MRGIDRCNVSRRGAVSKIADMNFVRGLCNRQRVAVFAVTQRARDWASNTLTASGNFGSVFVYFANEQETTTLKELAQGGRLQVAEAFV